MSGVVAVAAGDSHTVAIKGDGTAVNWGSNANGQLGNGTTTSSTVPVTVNSNLFANTAATRALFASGGYHALVVQPDGTLMAWGDNSCGQLGDGTTTSQANAETIPGLGSVSSVATGIYHSLALKSDGTVRAWGYNLAGQLGDGTQTSTSLQCRYGARRQRLPEQRSGGGRGQLLLAGAKRGRHALGLGLQRRRRTGTPGAAPCIAPRPCRSPGG